MNSNLYKYTLPYPQIGSQDLAFFAVQTKEIRMQGKREPTWKQLLSMEAGNRATPDVRVRQKGHASVKGVDMRVSLA